MSDPELLKVTYNSGLSTYITSHTHMSVARYILYVVNDVALAVFNQSQWHIMWMITYHVAYAVIYSFEFCLYKDLEQLRRLLQLDVEDLVAFRKKVEDQSTLSLAGIFRITLIMI